MLGVYVVWGMALRGLIVICVGRRFESKCVVPVFKYPGLCVGSSNGRTELVRGLLKACTVFWKLFIASKYF